MKTLSRTLRSLALLACVLAWATAAQADEAAMPKLVALLDGREAPLPTVKADFDVFIQGDLASIKVTQVFENPYDTPLHARYSFPLPSEAAVFAMKLVSGDRMIEAEIREKQEARAVFEHAKQRGNQAALLEQQRPNVFTQEVANLMPGVPIRVELEYAHAVTKSHGAYRFHIPTVVGPRFLAKTGVAGAAGAPTRRDDEPKPLTLGRWNLPASPPVAGPGRVDSERIAIRVALDAGMPIQWLESPSHGISVGHPSEFERLVTLAAGRTVDNKDFELHYRLAGETVAAGLTHFVDDDEGFLSLLIEPPEDADDASITPREMVFVLDCSGSMSGTPLAASKRFMRRTLRNMRANDSFRIIRFSDAATEWSEQPLPATPGNLRDGERYVDALYGGGGTHMASGIRAALAPAVEEGVLRIVVFLTDGYIGNDVEIVRLLDAKRGDARLFSFGIGNSVNRYLIQEMARVGRGAARIVKPSEDAETAADELVERLAAPVLTDIEIDWADAVIHDVFPREIPDLFLGQTVRILGRYHVGGDHRITVKGKIAGHPVAMPLDISLPVPNGWNADGAGQALPILWARSQVEDRMVTFLAPGISEVRRDQLQAEVTELGLRHRLMTQWTSFVAVAKAVVNPGGRARAADVAVAQVEGVPDTAYPASTLPQGRAKPQPSLHPGGPTGKLVMAAASGFAGRAAPEPATWLALLGIGGAAFVGRRRIGAAN